MGQKIYRYTEITVQIYQDGYNNNVKIIYKNKCWWGCGETAPVQLLVGMETVQLLWAQSGGLSKSYTELWSNLEIPLSGIYAREMQTYIPTHNL